jgi:glucose/arabinose dehydrogenase
MLNLSSIQHKIQDMKPFTKILLVISFISLSAFTACAGDTTQAKKTPGRTAPDDNAGLTLPTGFNAVVVADNLRGARHIVVNANGDVYVKLEKLKDGNGIFRLRDTNGDGKADEQKGFGNYTGTGIAIKNGYLYASSDQDVYRYKLDAKNEVSNPTAPERIITGLWNHHQHSSKSIALDNAGNIYVNIGAPSNACQVQDRTKGSPGQDPCPILDSAGGIWQFKVDQLNQSYAQGTRYCTGIRNIVGLDWNNETNELYAMQHGRDDLHRLFDNMYTEEQSSVLPAEEMLRVKKGSNFGWPYCYYDQFQSKKLLNPEYGGDSKKQDRCANVDQPIYAFPGHLAPNALLFYTGNMFPEKYKNGAFIAFHGSWNRAPKPQAGFFVVFLSFKNGMPDGNWEVFADGFAGSEENRSSGNAKHRPCGLAQAPDGSLYVTDDAGGTVYKIVYKKN